jgi:hypothetical protein
VIKRMQNEPSNQRTRTKNRLAKTAESDVNLVRPVSFGNKQQPNTRR